MKMHEITESNNRLSEGAYEAGFSDGKRGKQDPRASSKYGPDMDKYDQGYSAGRKEAEKEKSQSKPSAAASAGAKFSEKLKTLDDNELKALSKKYDAKVDELVRQAQSARDGASREQAKKEYQDVSYKAQLIGHQLAQRGLGESASAGATSAGAVASIANPPSKKKKKSSAYNADGTIKNALDVDTNVVGGKTVRR